MNSILNKKVFVIIVTYNGEQWIDKCLSSLRESSVPLEVYALDNCSTDNTVSAIRTRYPEVNLIETGSNLGFGKANNIGLKIAIEKNADFVFLLNQDAYFLPDTMQALLIAYQNNPEYGILSPIHLHPKHGGLEWYFSTYVVPEKCKEFYSDIYMRKPKEIYELPFVNAAAWLIPVHYLKIIGGFDPLYPHYGEDEDYCSRTLYKKIKIGVVPSSIIYHDGEVKNWETVKFNLKRQLIVVFIELKNIQLSYKFLLLNFLKTKFDRCVYLLIFRKWKELFFTIKLTFTSVTYFRKISKSRKEARTSMAYLK
ncbi:glycosyltransferase family 2 protein [Ferruginibacter lapsinanis]|uniref:glycosyltransferase family 2 protein n=1 Tax=Ferruginibacter lapsinanis TaxID=563172 RepID=UPI001E51C8EF|nr:glycosyltransferase family 2 protein [Ferruginibacter lapsinanis]UEG49463.1 glycosyltransferase family 2 protein [Ferruginibacter lapsinanis]